MKISGESGFTLVEIVIVVAIIGLLAAIALPNLVKSRQSARQNACIANLKQIESTIKQWALEEKKTAGAPVTSSDIIGATLYIKSAPLCPMDAQRSFATSYSLTDVSADPTCRIDATNHKLD